MVKKILNYLLRTPLIPSFIKIVVLRMNGQIGINFKLGSGSFVYSNKIKIGHNVTIMKNVIIQSDEVVIGNDTKILNDVSITAKKKVEIGSDCVVSDQVIIGGGQTPESELYMGKRVHVYPFCFLNTTRKLVLEDGVGVGGGTYIFTHGSWQDAYEGFPYVFAPVTIKKNAWLPWRVFVMPGVTIGEEATIGSDALITKDIPPRSFAVGVPAKVIKQGFGYIKEMTFEKKLMLMEEIFRAFSSHELCFKKKKSELVTNPDQLCLVFDNFKILYAVEIEKRLKKTLFVTELDIDTAIETHVFDLKNKRCRWPLNEIENDFHIFITNYGIRLDIEGKYE